MDRATGGLMPTLEAESVAPSAIPGTHDAPGFKRMLFMAHYPPSTLGGAPIIMRQVLRNYDMERLHVLCSQEWYDGQTDLVRNSFLPCPHTAIPTFRKIRLRPHRIFGRFMDNLECLRLPQVMETGRRIIRENNMEAIFTAPYGCEMMLAAYHLSREFDIPLYVFESDDWSATQANQHGLARFLVQKYHVPLIQSARKLFLTSPNMVREYEKRFGVRGEFLFHFINVASYEKAARELSPPDDKIHIVYTGSINTMFQDTMLWFADILNRGLTIGGKPVEMTIHTSADVTPYLGTNVHKGEYVALEDVPKLLAQAHVLAILVSFTDDPTLRRMIQTSLYTKTVDYLASGRPVLVVAPRYSGEVDYFGDTTCVVDAPDETRVVDALTRCVTDESYRTELRGKGWDLVQSRHSMESLEGIVLRHFREGAD